jgi:hypothetical protein
MTRAADEERKLRKALAGSTTTQTFFSRAEAEIILQSQGRHAAAAKAQVNGAEASVRYPRLPTDNPFTSDISGVEPPTGIDINWQEPNGTPVEIAESLREAASLAIPSRDAADEATEVDDHSASGAEAPPVVLSPAGGASLRRGRKL